MNKLNVLIVDDEQIYRDEVAEFLDGSECNTFKAGSPSVALKVLDETEIDLMFLDIKLPETDGLSFLKTIKEKFPELEVIMITGHGNMENVIEALRLGAIDFINKPFGTLEIRSALERSKRFIELSHKLKKAELNYNTTSEKLFKILNHKIIGKSEGMKNTLNMMKRVSETDDTSVLITGKTGTGKELVASGIHHLSTRSLNVFYDVNCSAIPENLFESEFFGHVKGAFTGAVENKAGWFEIANNGTLFLDEIGDMPLNQQIKLLRVLEERKIRRIGYHKEVKVNVRVIAATNKDLNQLIKAGGFREDLYHRISTFNIHVNSLKDRKEDIPLLLEYFVKSFAGKMRKNITQIDENIISRLQNYNFPGNIRELKNMVEKAVIMCDGSTLQTKHFSLGSSTVIGENSATLDLDELEKQAILKALSLTSMKSEAAKLLNITHQSLNRKLKKFKLE